MFLSLPVHKQENKILGGLPRRASLIDELKQRGQLNALIGDLNIHSMKLMGSQKDSRNAQMLEDMVDELNLVVANGLDGKDLGILKGSAQAQ